MDRVAQAQRRDHRRKVVGIGVEVVAAPGLARSAVTPAVVGYAAVASRGEVEHLIFERIGAEGPPMAEHDGLAATPILDVDVRVILGFDVGHELKSPVYVGEERRPKRLAGAPPLGREGAPSKGL